MHSAEHANSFHDYWDSLDDELARYPAMPEVNEIPLRSTEDSTVYEVKLTSIGPYRIFGFFSVPTGEGPFPGLLRTPRYGSVNNPPHHEDRQRYAILILMHRGQRLADQPFAASYPGLLTLGIDHPANYIYRSIVADCIRGAEFLLSRPEVDVTRVGIVGDELALITAARRRQFAAVQLSSLMFHQLNKRRYTTDSYPTEEVNDYLRMYPERHDAVDTTLSYFEPVRHAPLVTSKVALSIGAAGMGKPDEVQPLTEAFPGLVERYDLTHEGGTDHDWLDTWLANQLGTDPKLRVRETDQ